MLKQQIQKDLVDGLKNKNELNVSVLRMLQAAIINKEKEKRTKLSKTEKDETKLVRLSELNDDEIIDVASSEIKKRKDAVEQYKLANRSELAEKEQKEIEILKKYLPEQLSEADLKKLIDKEIKKVGAASLKDMSRVMAQLMPKIKGKADGSMVSKLIKEKLS